MPLSPLRLRPLTGKARGPFPDQRRFPGNSTGAPDKTNRGPDRRRQKPPLFSGKTSPRAKKRTGTSPVLPEPRRNQRPPPHPPNLGEEKKRDAEREKGTFLEKIPPFLPQTLWRYSPSHLTRMAFSLPFSRMALRPLLTCAARSALSLLNTKPIYSASSVRKATFMRSLYPSLRLA